MLQPSNQIWPADGSRSPVSSETVVDFPEPFGPSNPRIAPGPIVKLISRIAGIGGVVLRQVARFELALHLRRI